MKTVKIKQSDIEAIPNKRLRDFVRDAVKPGNVTKMEQALGIDIVLDDGAAPDTDIQDTPNASPIRPHATTFLRNGAKVTSHVMMSPKLSDADRAELIAYNKAQGYGVMYIYLANEGDYGGRSVAYRHEDIAFWRTWLERIMDSGSRVIVWMCADDSSGLAKRTLAQWESLVTQFNKDCGDLVSEWVTGLECNERWTATFTQQLTAMIQRVTGKPVGVHTTGLSAVGFAKGAHKLYLQTGFGMKPAQVAAQVKDAIAKFGGPVICAEYHKSGESAEAKAIGDAAIAAGAAGVGNGCTSKGLAMLAGQSTGTTPENPATGILRSAKWQGFPKIKVDAPEIESWKTKTVDSAICCAQLFVDGKKVEWIKRGNDGKSSVWNALNKADARYYRPGFAAQKTCEISVADVDGKNESNRITIEKPTE